MSATTLTESTAEYRAILSLGISAEAIYGMVAAALVGWHLGRGTILDKGDVPPN